MSIFSGLFTKRPETYERVVALRPCHCGVMSYGALRAFDTVYCHGCGAFYLIEGGVIDKVAKLETYTEGEE